MARTTGYTCSAVARLVIDGRYKKKGISPPEFVGKENDCFSYVASYLKERNVLYKHALKNALIPLITMIAIDFPYVFTGAVVVEQIFSWPGMGRLYYNSATSRDYPMLMGVLILGSAVIVLSNLMADIIYAYLDPRVRYD